MRMDTPIFFQRVEAGEYDSVTGDYGEDTVIETAVDACVTDTGTEALKLVYGTLQQGSLTIRLQNHYTKPFDRIRIGNALYKVDFNKKHRVKHVFVVSEVQ